MKQICQNCNGTGQISFFKGVSRFLLTCEECPECAGLGFQPETGSPRKPVVHKSSMVGRKRGRKS